MLAVDALAACDPLIMPDWCEPSCFFPEPISHHRVLEDIEWRIVELCAECPVRLDCRMEGLDRPLRGFEIRGGWLFYGGRMTTNMSHPKSVDVYSLDTRQLVAQMRDGVLLGARVGLLKPLNRLGVQA